MGWPDLFLVFREKEDSFKFTGMYGLYYFVWEKDSFFNIPAAGIDGMAKMSFLF